MHMSQKLISISYEDHQERRQMCWGSVSPPCEYILCGIIPNILTHNTADNQSLGLLHWLENCKITHLNSTEFLRKVCSRPLPWGRILVPPEWFPLDYHWTPSPINLTVWTAVELENWQMFVCFWRKKLSFLFVFKRVTTLRNRLVSYTFSDISKSSFVNYISNYLKAFTECEIFIWLNL